MIIGEVKQIEQVWPRVAPIVFVHRSEAEYERLVAVLDQLIDVVGGDEAHPLASLMEIVGILVENYEHEHVPEMTEVL